MVWAFLVLLTVLSGMHESLQGQVAGPHPISLTDGASAEQYSFLMPALKDAEVVSLAESIHMTHEFPLVRIGMVQWLHEQRGFDMLAMEGSPEDLWVSQDAFLHDPANIAASTSGVFGVWNTAEMRQLFAYEASTWKTRRPLYITAYDIQPGTGRSSQGARVFELLAQRLGRYAPAPEGFDEARWSASFAPLTHACGNFKGGDTANITESIGVLQEWINRAAPTVDAAFASLPHGTLLRMIPENLRASLNLCQQYVEGGSSGAALYKPTRDKNAAQFALDLKAAAPGQRLMLWAHVSHLFYDAEGGSTSVGEILRASLGTRLYTIGTFAESGSAIMLFSDWNDIIGYGRVWGVSSALKRRLDGGCADVCFYDLRGATADDALSQPQPVWFEATREVMTLAKDLDGVVWVRQVHPPEMTLTEMMAFCTPRYWMYVAARLLALLLFIGVLALIGRAVWHRRRGKARQRPQAVED
jgi:erythromycin esterase-like protein